MNDGLYDLLSRRAKIALNVLTGIAAVALLYSFQFLSQGPMHWMAGWISDADGQYYVELAFLLSFLPICMADWLIVYGLDRGLSRWKRRPAKASALPMEVVRRIE
jgi:hypothetical protein